MIPKSEAANTREIRAKGCVIIYPDEATPDEIEDIIVATLGREDDDVE